MRIPTHEGWPDEWCIPNETYRIAEIVFEVAERCTYLSAAGGLRAAADPCVLPCRPGEVLHRNHGVRTNAFSVLIRGRVWPMRRGFSFTDANSGFGWYHKRLPAFSDVLAIFLQSLARWQDFTYVTGVIVRASAIHDYWVVSTGSRRWLPSGATRK